MVVVGYKKAPSESGWTADGAGGMVLLAGEMSRGLISDGQGWDQLSTTSMITWVWEA